jgi:uncharacterized protein YhdP
MNRKKLVLIAAGALLLLAAAAGLLALTLNRVIASNRSLIEQKAEQALGRKIRFDEARASLWGGVGISVKGLSIEEDPGQAGVPFFQVPEMVLRLKFLPLLRKQIDVVKFLLIEPKVRIIRSAQGFFNFATLGKRAGEKEPREKEKKPKGEGALAILALATIEVRDGEFLFEDRAKGAARPLVFRKLNLLIDNKGLAKPIKLSFKVAISHPSPDLSLRGEVRDLLTEHGINAGRAGLDFELEGKEIRIDVLRDSFPVLQTVFPPQLRWKGPLSFKVTAKGDMSRLSVRMEADAKGSEVQYGNQFRKPAGTPFLVKGEALREPQKITIPKASLALGEARVSLRAESARDPKTQQLATTYAAESPMLPLSLFQPERGDDFLKELSVSGKIEPSGMHTLALKASEAKLQGFLLGPVSLAARMEGDQVSLPKIDARLYGGVASGQATYNRREPSPTFSTNLVLKGVDLPGLLAARVKNSEWKITGKLDSNLQLSGAGKNWAEIQKGLTGNGMADVREGSLKDFNLLEAVFSKTTGIPGLSESLAAKVRPKYRHLFDGRETNFEKLRLVYRIAGGKILADDLTIQSPDYAMRAKGWVGFDRQANLDSNLTMSEQFSSDIVADHRNASYFTNREGRLSFPFKLTGAIPRLKPEIDPKHFTGIAEKALMGKALDRVQKKLQPSEGERKKEKPEKEVLRNLLEGFLGGEKR